MKIVKMKLGFWLLPHYHNNKATNGQIIGIYWLKYHFILKSVIKNPNPCIEKLKQLNIKEIENGRNY